MCSLCTAIVPNASLCKYEYTCELTASSNTGNNCKPKLRVLNCSGYNTVGNDEGEYCIGCAEVIYGCNQCSDREVCKVCNMAINLTVDKVTGKCVCQAGRICGPLCNPA